MENETVWEVIRRNQQRWPVPVVKLANELGIGVYEVDGWPDNISGRIYRSDERGGAAGYAIDVNRRHALVRRRFTIAHEIAHFVLHRSRIGDELYDDGLYRSGLPSSMEVQANRLAAKILIPDHLLQRAWASGISSPEALAQAFQVSEASMRIKLGVFA